LDDVTPPVTVAVLDPLPNEHGWWSSKVTLSLNATDDESGVNVTYVKIGNGGWEVYSGNLLFQTEGRIVIQFYSVDNAGNVEEANQVEIKIDRTVPQITTTKEILLHEIRYTAIVNDSLSGINRVEFYMSGKLRATDTEAPYQWTYSFQEPPFKLTGIIANPQYGEDTINIPVRVCLCRSNGDNLTFRATVWDNAGNSAWAEPSYRTGFLYSWIFFKTVVVPKSYTGHLGRFFIHATFPAFP